ncbi:DNA polymerase III subunit delta [Actinobacillus succinogenes]|uniref:DNA polymerase III subunit delta n=1 Tax=Actinobacillus succinogenes (strain ATCC 55618 / DSM 22257 / CCUG 43843 / 130Z) TaxID=339671 RepID=A6VMC1_ACTSZ|nr:DNA polymerase III subunit delta [Actinobacillus succinogenes]ABR74118.1 DNA polymerase III, delta subunit [Actinobacillus succinogenes 130Z]PHI39449.1 DNA polymerase III subunit delta [Actinobacillus succinogenes]
MALTRIFPEQLASSLSQRLASLYYLVGQDPLLLTESRDLIIKTATAQGFDERREVTVDNATDWIDLQERCQSRGLFFNKQIISLILPENLTALLQKNLAEFMAVLNEDVLLIVQFVRISKLFEKSEWHKRALNYETSIVQVNCQTPTAEQLPRWAANRVKAMGLTVGQDALQLLCYSYENNLLAMKQALELLALLHSDKKLTFERVQKVAEQSSTFTAFQWIDAVLAGKEARARRILNGLRAEDVQPVVLLRTLQRELMTLLELSKPTQRFNGIDEPLPVVQLREGFDRLKVWQNRRNLYLLTFQRLTYRKLYRIIQQLADLERTAKLDFGADIWDRLADISVKIALGK